MTTHNVSEKMKQKIGVLLINTGSPASPKRKDVAKYLKEFLMDERVIDIPYLLRLFLIYGIIVPIRSGKSAKNYAMVWRDNLSPLLDISYSFRNKLNLAVSSNSIVFEVAFRYGQPSIKNSLEKLLEEKVDKVLIAPLFPHYASASTGSAVAEAFDVLKKKWNIPSIETLAPFYDHPAFIKSFVHVIEKNIRDFRPCHLLFSYHGLPERHILKSEQLERQRQCLTENCCDQIKTFNSYCYKAQCYETTRLILKSLNTTVPSSTSFQSRLGKTPWIKPYTDEELEKLASKGVKRLVVICPAFVADCLETIHEIAIDALEEWKSFGGEELLLVPSLNSEDVWVKNFLEILGLPLKN